jgi:hypothetical protein
VICSVPWLGSRHVQWASGRAVPVTFVPLWHLCVFACMHACTHAWLRCGLRGSSTPPPYCHCVQSIVDVEKQISERLREERYATLHCSLLPTCLIQGPHRAGLCACAVTNSGVQFSLRLLSLLSPYRACLPPPTHHPRSACRYTDCVTLVIQCQRVLQSARAQPYEALHTLRERMQVQLPRLRDDFDHELQALVSAPTFSPQK